MIGQEEHGYSGSSAPIGVIDSGVGGLTILREIQQELPAESLIYIGDTAHCPYGARSPEDILRLTRTLVTNLLAENVKAVVIACNTISVHCIEALRADYPDLPFVGTAPAIKPAAAMSARKRIGILSTVATAESRYQADLIAQFASDCTVVNLGTNALVPLIERAEWDGELTALLPRLLRPFHEEAVDVVVLGCSHYPIIRAQIERELGPGVQVIDSGAAIARQLRRVLTQSGKLTSETAPVYAFHDTGGSPSFAPILARLGIRDTPSAIAAG